MTTVGQISYILFLSFFQNASFSVVSRARNRSSKTYHIIASVFSNGIWHLTFRALVLADMTPALFIPYTIGTAMGSLGGANVSMVIERWLGATSDGHLKPVPLSVAEKSAVIQSMLKDTPESEWKQILEKLRAAA